MIYNKDFFTEEDNVIYIDGTADELFPGLNDIMRRLSELYIDNYMDLDYPDSLGENEPIMINFTKLSGEEMSELISCALTSIELESECGRPELLS